MEEGIVGKTTIPFYGISVQGFRGKGLLKQLFAPFRMLSALLQAISIIRKVKPDAVLGMGGFASGPGGLASRILGVPLLIHEQNSVAGLTNKILSKFAKTVMTAFPGAFEESVNVKLLGNPLRAEVVRLYYEQKPALNDQRKIHLLILGGSLGAQSLNETLPEALKLMPAALRPAIRHQTGKAKDAPVKAAYQSNDIDAEVAEFITDMADAYRWADFVICRAGALTISELCVAGLGAILVPYPFAVDDHQTRNAQFMVEGGAAWLLPQAELNPSVLAEMMIPLFAKRERLTILSDAARKLAKVDATEQVSDECRRVCYA
jgi:UDP-N-acetylglucosamine--N-acetylmuramyl-(pentapeptide) pyrophosphoryl-undecaprenol N-acetylglucosamine transferase